MHALIHRSTQDTRQLCSVWEPGQRIYQAFPSRCQSRQPSFHSLTFQFYPPALSPWNSPLPLLSSPTLSLSFLAPSLSYSPSYFLPVLKSNPRAVNHCILLPRWGWDWVWRPDTFAERFSMYTKSDLPVVLSPGGVVHSNMGVLISITVCLLLLLSICSSVSFMLLLSSPLSLPVLLYLSLSLWHQLHLFHSCSLAVSHLHFPSLPFSFTLFWFWPCALFMLSCLS